MVGGIRDGPGLEEGGLALGEEVGGAPIPLGGALVGGLLDDCERAPIDGGIG